MPVWLLVLLIVLAVLLALAALRQRLRQYNPLPKFTRTRPRLFTVTRRPTRRDADTPDFDTFSHDDRLSGTRLR